ncbi:hypothetical protein B0H13DRAFT_2305229 [Mycena leptocephala]|nr:hypothetical protein B0H13DRAFT_2305229 [Mycena leptocephala]
MSRRKPTTDPLDEIRQLKAQLSQRDSQLGPGWAYLRMLNLSPGSPVERTAREDTTPVLPVSQRNSVMEMEKTPFKDHNLQDGRGRYAADRSMAADEMH